MIILSLSDIQPTSFQTPWGREMGICYLGKTFLPIDVHSNQQEAIAACRQDLDAGMMSIVVDEGDRVSLWWYFAEIQKPDETKFS
ncbi:MAG: hypothetical protein DCF19_16055 [Pseudanabaena frigida]|uniref:Uncharacterized protein n=1 Tax=Pseudanabaena frigida TaxID=945775 RepID=A0A2W4W0K6_9CYAN|nr:MAG: hypothetical protein DCF19_16055 [Pseudanabaena frigida]